MFTDTDPKTEKYLIKRIRGSSIQERIGRTLSLSHTVIMLSRRAIQRANPELSEKDVLLRFVERHYGKNLAITLSAYMVKKDGST